MAEVYAFRGWRYDLAQVGSLSDVTAPPYDVIDATQQKELYERHPCNVVRLILNRDEPGDHSPDAKYTRAADFLRRWCSEGVLGQERDEAIYAYHQAFEWEGREYVRKGFLARLRLEEFGRGQVYPHEQTMSGPKADRLTLTKACRMNLSPIFGLFPDPQSTAQLPLEDSIRGATPLEAMDDLGIVHRLWPATDRAAIDAVRSGLKDKPIFIADGHHRYETALNYREWLNSQGRLVDDSAPANFVLMMFVGMSDPGLVILPTHRLVSGLPHLSSGDFEGVLADHFALEQVGSGGEAARRTWEAIESDGGQNVFGFGTAADAKWLLARLKNDTALEALVPGQSKAWRSLGVSVLHKLVIENLLVRKYPDGEPSCKYVHRMDEVTDALAQHSCQLACLVPPAEIGHVQEIASRYEKMPPKSTYFYPKLLSGLVFNPLE